MDFMEFEDNGRKLTCQRASSPATPGTSWWWLDVSGESQRYAAFRSEAGDTPENLRSRMVAYYAKLLMDRARPPEVRRSWGRPAAAVPAAVPAVPPVPAEPVTE